jgi:predicted Zn-dependent protease
VVSSAYEEQVLQRAFANTRGASGVEHGTRFRVRIDARLGRAGPVHRHQVAARQFAGIASMPFGQDLGERLRRLSNPVDLPSEPLPVILEPRPLAHILRSLARACVAREVDAGRSFLSGLPGRRVASPRLHVIDDPTMPGGLHSRAFDDRGVAPVPVVILREGVAAGLYLDPETARAAELRPTGHDMGGSPRPSNLVVRPGSRTRNAIGMDLDDYLTLDEIHAETPVDVATGLLEATCDLLLYRGHRLRGAIAGRPLRLPVATFLAGIREVASDQLRVEEVDACPLVLDPFDLTP